MTAPPTAASTRPPLPPGRRGRLYLAFLQDAALVVFFAVFFVSHARWVLDGRFTSVPFALENGLLLGIYLTRRRSTVTSSRIMDWIWAMGGGWLPLAMQVRGDSPEMAAGIGLAVQTLGLSLVIISMGSLGRSFGIVAANRGLKTGGPYGLVRHPVYAAHVITQTGLILANPLGINVVILAVALFCQVKRMDAEERLLTETSEYREYKDKVRYRLLPGIY